MKRILKWTGIVLGSLFALILVALAVVYVVSNSRMNRSYTVDPVALTIPPADSAMLARGRHLAETRACTGCHTPNLGGEVMADDPALGRLSSANLTSGNGGIGAHYTDRDWIRAIRHGVNPEGKPLLLMPSHEFVPLGREDLIALIAYLKQLPPVDHTLPENNLGPLARVLYVTGAMPLVSAEIIDHEAPLSEVPSAGITAEYGRYLSAPCAGCHGEGLEGGSTGPPGTPPAANLTVLQDWSEADFFSAVRTGIRPSGDTLHAFMPRWEALTDDEVRALWTYVQTLKPRQNDLAAQ